MLGKIFTRVRVKPSLHEPMPKKLLQRKSHLEEVEVPGWGLIAVCHFALEASGDMSELAIGLTANLQVQTPLPNASGVRRLASGSARPAPALLAKPESTLCATPRRGSRGPSPAAVDGRSRGRLMPRRDVSCSPTARSPPLQGNPHLLPQHLLHGCASTLVPASAGGHYLHHHAAMHPSMPPEHAAFLSQERAASPAYPPPYTHTHTHKLSSAATARCCR